MLTCIVMRVACIGGKVAALSIGGSFTKKCYEKISKSSDIIRFIETRKIIGGHAFIIDLNILRKNFFCFELLIIFKFM